jgi:predicted permease
MKWVKQLFSRRRLYGELSEEIREHLEEKIEELVADGMSRKEAAAAARSKFGNVTLIEEDSRKVWQWPSIEDFLMDVRYGARVLRKNPGFTAVAITSLALAIGANTAIFSLLNGLALRDLPVPQPEQLVRFGAQSGDEPFVALSLPLFEEISSGQKVFSSTFGWWGDNLSTVEIGGALSRNNIWAVTGNFYSELGANPELGRLIGPEDDDLKAASPTPVAVLAYSFWQRHYGGDRNIIGKMLKIEGAAFTIIGVTHPGFTGISADRPPEITIPLTAEPLLAGDSDVQKHLRRADAFLLEAAGRLKPHVRFGEARAQLESIWPAIRGALAPPNLAPADRANFLGLQMKVEPGEKGASALRKQFTKPLYVLLAISGLVLLVACVNLATLMLSRAAARSHEIAVRIALGASRMRLVRQTLTESIMLSVAGTLAGFFLAYWWSRTLADFILGQFFNAPAHLNLTPDMRVLLSTATVAVLTGVLFGLAPAWRATREDPNIALQRNAQKFSRSTGRLGKSLIVTQVALSLVLLAAAGLFIRTLKKLRTIEPGYQARGVLDASLYPKPGGYKDLDRVNYYQELTARVSRLPGVESAGIAKMSLGWRAWREDVRASEASDAGVKVDFALVMPGFFHTVGIYPQRGRIFTWRDDDRAPRVAVVSESVAKKLFAGREAIGQRLEITTEPTWQKVEIVGIVSDASLYDIREHAPPTLYVPSTQYGEFMGWSQMMLRTKAAPAAMANAVRQTVDSLGHEYVAKTHMVVETIDRSILRERVFAILSAFFGGLALLLAGIGLYGLMAYNVTRRTQEIGVRIALGAAQSNVLSMILRETLGLTSIGLALGLACALAASQLIANMLYGVSAQDPVTLATVSVVLSAVAAVAGWIPARRAMRVDPMVALRYE